MESVMEYRLITGILKSDMHSLVWILSIKTTTKSVNWPREKVLFYISITYSLAIIFHLKPDGKLFSLYKIISEKNNKEKEKLWEINEI